MKIRCIIDTGGKVNTPRTIRVSARKSWQKALEGSEPCAAERRRALSRHIYNRDADTRVQTCNFPSHGDAYTRARIPHTHTRARQGPRREFNFNGRFFLTNLQSRPLVGGNFRKMSDNLDGFFRRFLPYSIKSYPIMKP